jgi:hypothetical protein
VIVEATRRLLDSGDMTTSGSKELGEILHRLLPAVKSATGVQRHAPLGIGALADWCRRTDQRASPDSRL